MIVHQIFDFAVQSPHKQAVVCGSSSVTYAQLKAKVLQMLPAIAQHKAQTVFLNHANALENLYGLLAANACGKRAVFVPKTENEAQLSTQFKSLDFVFYSEIDFEVNHPKFEFYELPHAQKHDIFLGVYTSGSTGQPKLIWKDYQAWISAFTHQTEVFGVLPHHHLMVLDALGYSANLNAVLHHLWQGGTVYLSQLNQAKNWAEEIVDKKIDSIFLVPSHLRLLKNLKENIGTVSSIVTAGEKLDVDTAQKIRKVFPNALLTEYYGSAELGHITYHQNEAIVKNGLSVGAVFPEVEISFVESQIVVKSPYVSPDYRNKPTNFDLGFFENGQLILMGREGRMFNRRGLNVFAQEIENAAMSLSWVAEAVVLAQKDEKHQDQMLLLYTSRHQFENNSNSKLILANLSAVLHKTKVPKKAEEWQSFPRNMAGKIDYTALKRSFEAESSLVAKAPLR